MPKTRGLNLNFHRTLKYIFKGAAATVIAHARPNPFPEAYERLCRVAAVLSPLDRLPLET